MNDVSWNTRDHLPTGHVRPLLSCNDKRDEGVQTKSDHADQPNPREELEDHGTNIMNADMKRVWETSGRVILCKQSLQACSEERGNGFVACSGGDQERRQEPSKLQAEVGGAGNTYE